MLPTKFGSSAVRRLLATRGSRMTMQKTAFFSSTTTQSQSSIPGVVGESLDHYLDLDHMRVGQRLDIPYELTVSDAWKTLWHSCFFQHDRPFTSDDFAQKRLKLSGAVLPTSLLTFLTGTMSHLDDTREVLDLGYANMVYERPAFAGDTFHKVFHLRSMRPTSDGNSTIVTAQCELFNAQDQRVFSLEKTMMYTQISPPTARENRFGTGSQSDAEPAHSYLRQHIIDMQERLPPKATSLKKLSKGQLLLHGHARPVTATESMQLSGLVRMTHPSVFNALYLGHQSNLVVPGGLVLAAAHACSARGLHEVLHENILECSFLNKVTPGDIISSFSFVLDKRSISHKLEELTIRTIGLKNCDAARELEGISIPNELLQPEHNIKPKEFEELCKKHCPALHGKVVSQSVRTLLRQCPEDDHVFLL